MFEKANHPIPNLEGVFESLKTPQAKAALCLAIENIQVLDRKQLDYGPENISVFGEFGVLVRSSDKLERLKNLHKSGNATAATSESISDSWMDLANYALIAVLLRKGLWK
tara:strand:- start:174 stop:503 length:330 start_codon:yes stop_codon:yes gene_type:complete